MNVFLYTHFINNCIWNDDLERALAIVLNMKGKDIEPNYAIYIPLLKAATVKKNIQVGMTLYQLVKKSNLASPQLSTTIISFALKLRKPELVIEEIELVKQQKWMTIITWNSLIQAYIQENNIKKAIDVIHEMKDNGICPDSATFNILITACANTKLFAEGKLIHKITTNTLKDNCSVELLTSIINFYTKCGHPEIAINECEKMKSKGLMNVVSFTCLVEAYIQINEIQKAIDTVTEMKQFKVTPNATTFSILLTACAKLKLYKEGILIHKIANNTLRDNSSLKLLTSIINFYTKCGHPDIAINEFRQAIEIITEMQDYGVEPNSTTFNILLTACADSKLFEEGKAIHKLATGTLKDYSSELLASIVNFYTKCGHPETAIKECEQLKSKGLMNNIVWNCLIQAYIQNKEVRQAIEVITEMQDYGIEPNSTTFNILLKACADSKLFEEGKLLHQASGQVLNNPTIELNNKMQQFGLNPDSTTYTIILKACTDFNLFEEGKLIHEQAIENVKDCSTELLTSIISFYTKCGHPEVSIGECEKLQSKGLMNNVAVWNCLIQAHIQTKEVPKSIKIITEMQDCGVEPNSTTFNILLTACADSKLFEEGKAIHKLATGTLKDHSSELLASIVNFYTKCGHPEVSIEECEQLKSKGLMNDVAIWNCLIQAHIQSTTNTQNPSTIEYGLNKAMVVFNEMKEHIEPDKITYLILLAGCGEYFARKMGLDIIDELKLKGMDVHEEIVSVMIYFYSRIAYQSTAQQLFEKLVEESAQKRLSIITYNNMLSCYAQHGKGTQAMNLFNEMVAKNVEMNENTFTIMLNTFSHCGMIDEANQLYGEMKTKYNHNPSVIVDCVMVDVFARSGRFHEAEKIINERMNYSLWSALMAGCRKFNNVEKADNIRQLMIENGIKKIPGIVYQEEDGKSYQFVSGSKKYERFKEIEKMREEIYRKIIQAGFEPDTRWVTNSKLLTEEEKLDSLCRHAEKTATAHAFVLNPKRKSIILAANLRVCNDCHTATEFISKVMDVEIIIRDANRYHHFKDGKCSCDGYW
ncbi:predicted protein [Naegleria gruberi]|uniref:Predicted protein n=1 Tax=Naegleria gruberi TaxID=5762 RepID=D2W5L8_NAEGR|nr:uncharacterized protein NAEGRDRAFT_76708 [Naegleria gruberi]EFC35636.1 predicted protein [Naegleria gruberi]|eukprot:XP_002668380.1 predicted protein [Naegleria gruberi strain NEG-M]